MCWLSNKSKGHILHHPSNSIQTKITGEKESINVIEALKLKAHIHHTDMMHVLLRFGHHSQPLRDAVASQP